MADELLNYPSTPQLRRFQDGRKANQVSFFRAKPCEVCRKEIPREFRCCSPECYEALPKGDPMANIIWSIDLTGLQAGEWRFETHEGAVRKGKVTRINYKETKINGKVVQLPASIELNNDASDFLSWDVIKEATKV